MKNTFAFITIILCFTFYAFAYFARVEPGALLDDLMKDFSLNAAEIGTIAATIAYIPYVALQIPGGILSDKFGLRKVISLCSLLCAIGMLIFGSAQNSWQLAFGRFIIGLSASSSFLVCGKAAADLFDKSQYGLFMGIAMFLGCLGAVLGVNLSAYLAPILGWRYLTYYAAIVGIIVAILAYIFIKDPEPTNKSSNTNVLAGLKTLVCNKNVWLIGVYGFISYVPMSAIAELWGIPFIQNRFNVLLQDATICSAVVFISFGLGSIISERVAAKLKSYKKTIILFLILTLIFFAIAFYSDSINYITCLILFGLGGFFAGCNTLSFPVCYDLVPPEYAGTSTGFTNTIIMFNCIVFPPLLGKLLDVFRDGKVNSEGLPAYSISDYRHAFLFIIISLIIAIISVMFVKEKK